MATLKDHQQAMVDLMASGSGIPASAMRLAHAMHDVLCYLNSDNPIELDIKSVIRRVQTNSPGLNDKAISKREKPVKTDSPAKWPTSAEQRVKELENTIRQLKAHNAKLKLQNQDLRDDIGGMASKLHKLQMPEQAGCRKDDTQVCAHESAFYIGDECPDCGAIVK